MAWKISVSLERDPEALLVVQRMIYAAAKAQGASDVEACSAAHSLREALHPTGGEAPQGELADSAARPVHIDLEYDEGTLTLVILIRDQRQLPSVPGVGVRH